MCRNSTILNPCFIRSLLIFLIVSENLKGRHLQFATRGSGGWWIKHWYCKIATVWLESVSISIFEKPSVCAAICRPRRTAPITLHEEHYPYQCIWNNLLSKFQSYLSNIYMHPSHDFSSNHPCLIWTRKGVEGTIWKELEHLKYWNVS